MGQDLKSVRSPTPAQPHQTANPNAIMAELLIPVPSFGVGCSPVPVSTPAVVDGDTSGFDCLSPEGSQRRAETEQKNRAPMKPTPSGYPERY